MDTITPTRAATPNNGMRTIATVPMPELERMVGVPCTDIDGVGVGVGVGIAVGTRSKLQFN